MSKKIKYKPGALDKNIINPNSKLGLRKDLDRLHLLMRELKGQQKELNDNIDTRVRNLIKHVEHEKELKKELEEFNESLDKEREKDIKVSWFFIGCLAGCSLVGIIYLLIPWTK